MAAQKKVQKNAPRRKKKRKSRRKRYDMSRVWMALGLLALVLLVIVGVTRHQKNKAVSADSPVTLSEVDENRPELDVELLTVNPYSRPGTALEKVNGIVIHYTANPGATAIANRNYFENLKDTHTTKASSHFVVGLEGEIVQCIPTAEIAYASNDRNSDTISNECCYKNEDGSFEQAVKDGKVDEEGYKIDREGKRTSKQPVVFKADLDRLFNDSVAYNKKLETNQYEMLRNDTYSQAAVNLENYGITDGIYGYVTAETINMRLPIYLGANSSNMSYGAAHMSATSLPIGGKNTNAVLAGHTGYIGRIFFDNLRNLKIGDRVSITNYWDTLNYKVVETKVNKPSESGDCYLQKDRDLLTMFTCISDGNGGFDRYYVICERAS